MEKEKELEKNACEWKEEGGIGSVKIADDVVAMIAGIAATEVKGVAAMAGNVTNELMSKVGVKNLKKGVKVEVLNKVVKVDLALIMEYGYNIPASSRNISSNVPIVPIPYTATA